MTLYQLTVLQGGVDGGAEALTDMPRKMTLRNDVVLVAAQAVSIVINIIFIIIIREYLLLWLLLAVLIGLDTRDVRECVFFLRLLDSHDRRSTLFILVMLGPAHLLVTDALIRVEVPQVCWLRKVRERVLLNRRGRILIHIITIAIHLFRGLHAHAVDWRLGE